MCNERETAGVVASLSIPTGLRSGVVGDRVAGDKQSRGVDVGPRMTKREDGRRGQRPERIRKENRGRGGGFEGVEDSLLSLGSGWVEGPWRRGFR